MPTVPSPEGPRLSLQPGSGAAFRGVDSDALTLPGRQLEAQGQAMERAGSQFTDLFVQQQNEANVVRVQDLQNKVMQQTNDLTTNQQRTGYRDLMGLDALPEGKSLGDVYGEKLQKVMTDGAASLGNDAQRRMFNSWAADHLTAFKAQANNHMSDQFRTYRDSVDDATIETAGGNILTNYTDPEAMQQSLDAINGAVTNKARNAGLAPTDAAVLTKKMTGAYIVKLVSSLMDNGDTTAADALLERYKDHVTPEQMLDVATRVKGERELGQAQAAVKLAVPTFQQATQPGAQDMGSIWKALVHQESGGQQVRKDGSIVVSSKGAIGIAQIMPKTGPEAARLAGEKWDPNRFTTDAAYNEKLGKAYFGAQITRFAGDVAKALAAYNAGPRAVDRAVAKDPANWLSHMPAETQNYVASISKRVGGTGSAPPSSAPALPTEVDFVNTALSHLGENPNPRVVQKTTELAKQQYALLHSAQKDAEDNAYNAAVSQMQQNKLQFFDLPASVRNAVPAEKVSSLISLGKEMQAGPTASDPAVYELLTRPGVLATLSDAKFLTLKSQLSDSDFKHFAEERQKQLNPAAAKEGPGNINRERFNAIVNSRLAQIGVDTKPKAKDDKGNAHLGAIQKTLSDNVLDEQHRLGRQLSDEEMTKVVDGWMFKSVKTRNSFMGFAMGEGDPKRLLSVGADDLDAGVRSRIVASLKKAGNPNPTNADVLAVYYRKFR